MKKKSLRENLADLAHNQWSGWMRYLFSKCTTLPNGDMVIPSEFVNRWKRQIDTPYIALSEEEQHSDLLEAGKMIHTVLNWIINGE